MIHNEYIDYTCKYRNGNYIVSQRNNPLVLTKTALRRDEDLVSEFPDSIDLKISNRCSRGCEFCHERSVKGGDILNLEQTKAILSQLPELPIEIAMGGGNVLESLEETKDIATWLLERGHRIRCTLDLQSFLEITPEQRALLRKFGGVGISITKITPRLREILKDEEGKKTKFSGLNEYFYTILSDVEKVEDEDELNIFSRRNYFNSLSHQRENCKIIIHTIAGILPIEDFKLLVEGAKLPVLVLGYKQFGRAENTPLPESMKEYEEAVKQYMFLNRRNGKYGAGGRIKELAFDNLALEQLHLREALTKNEWDRLYLGEEGQFSMYIDAVKGEFAINSRSPERVSWNRVGLLDFFNSLKK